MSVEEELVYQLLLQLFSWAPVIDLWDWVPGSTPPDEDSRIP